jgi:hypothetical protein
MYKMRTGCELGALTKNFVALLTERMPASAEAKGMVSEETHRTVRMNIQVRIGVNTGMHELDVATANQSRPARLELTCHPGIIARGVEGLSGWEVGWDMWRLSHKSTGTVLIG